MRKNALPIGVLFMVLVVLLAGIGVSYGWWTETINTYADIDTGNLDVYWYSANTNGSGGAPGLASCTATPHGGNNNQLDVVIDEMHPGFTCHVNAWIKNNGTVPVSITVDGQDQWGTDIDGHLDLDVLGCPASIAPGATGKCEADLAMRENSDNSSQNKQTYYRLYVVADQVQSTP